MPPEIIPRTDAPTPPAGSWDLIIRKGLSEKNYWRDLWRYRELLYFLTWRGKPRRVTDRERKPSQELASIAGQRGVKWRALQPK